MTIYLASFQGHFLGGSAVIVASSKQKAIALLKTELKQSGLKYEDINWSKFKVDEESVVHFVNGDY